MIIILLIITGLFMLNIFKPSSFKMKTVKDIAEATFDACKKDENIFNITMALTRIFTYTYLIIMAVIINNLLFIGITVLYIAWSAMDFSTVDNYITKQQMHWSLNNRLYRFGSKILDILYFGYAIYMLIIKL